MASRLRSSNRSVRSVFKSLIRLAAISRNSDDGGPAQVHQVSYMGKTGDAATWEPYGFHANAPAGSLALMVSMQGNPEARVVMPGSPSDRPTSNPTEVNFYHPPTGSRITFKDDGTLEIDVKGDVTVNATGDVTAEAEGNVSVTAGGTADVTSTGNATITSAAKIVLATASSIEAALGATLKLLDERFFPLFNAHRHGDPFPGSVVHSNDQVTADGSANTTILKGS